MLVKRLHFLLLFVIFRGDLWNGRNTGTNEFDSAKWETPRWQHTDSMVQMQSNGLGCLCSRHLCRITHCRHGHRGRCSGKRGSSQQNRQIWWTGRYAHIYRVVIETGGTWKAAELDQVIGRRATLIHDDPKESTFLFCFSSCQWIFNGEMLSLSSTLLTPIRRRCSHALLSSILSLRLCASGRKKTKK